MVWFCTLPHFLYCVFKHLLVTALCRCLLPLELELSLVVASILVGLCRLLLFFYVYLLLFNFPVASLYLLHFVLRMFPYVFYLVYLCCLPQCCVDA